MQLRKLCVDLTKYSFIFFSIYSKIFALNFLYNHFWKHKCYWGCPLSMVRWFIGHACILVSNKFSKLHDCVTNRLYDNLSQHLERWPPPVGKYPEINKTNIDLPYWITDEINCGMNILSVSASCKLVVAPYISCQELFSVNYLLWSCILQRQYMHRSIDITSYKYSEYYRISNIS